MKNKKLIFLLVIVAIIYASLIPITKDNYYWDEVVYLHLAENIHNDFSYSSQINESFRPPLLPFLMSFFMPNITLIHSLIIAIMLLTLIVLYFFVKQLYDENKALLASALLASLPLFFFWSNKLLTEALSILLITLSLFLFYNFEKSNKNKFLYLSFVIAALAFLARPPNVAVIISFALYLLYKEKLKIFKQKKYYIASLLFFIILLPWFYINLKYYNHVIGGLLFQVGLNPPQKNYLFYFKNIISNLSFIFILFLIGITNIKQHFRKVKVVYFYLITYLILIIIFLADNTQNRFFLLSISPIIIISIEGYSLLIRKSCNFKKSINKILVILILISLMFSYAAVRSDLANTKILSDNLKELRDYPGDLVVCNSLPYCYYFSKKNVMYFPSDLEDFKIRIEEENIDYIIVDNYHIEPNYNDYIDENFNLIISKQNNYKYVKIYSTE